MFLLGLVFGMIFVGGIFALSRLILEYPEEETEEVEKQQINHPTHYNIPGRKECIVEMEEKFGPLAVYHFCICNNYKYVYRAGEKESTTKSDDMKKAGWYAKYADEIYKRIGEENKCQSGEN